MRSSVADVRLNAATGIAENGIGNYRRGTGAWGQLYKSKFISGNLQIFVPSIEIFLTNLAVADRIYNGEGKGVI